MSLFARKEKARIVELEAQLFEAQQAVLKEGMEVNRLNVELAEAGNRMSELVAQLQAVDQALWNFSQSINPNQARAAIGPAIAGMNERKLAEHNRITSILIPELKRTYGR